MTAFVSVLGLQPAATAATLESWIHWRGRPDRILLLATKQVADRGIAGRLRQAFPDLAATMVIEDVDDRPGGDRSVEGVVAGFLGRSKVDTVVIDVDPGPQHLIMQVVLQVVRAAPRATLLTTDMRNLVEVLPSGEVIARELRNVGLDRVLGLYGLTKKVTGLVSPEWTRLVGTQGGAASLLHGFAFATGAVDDAQFDLAYERFGYLFLMAAVSADIGDVRKIAAIRPHLNGLRPVIGIVSSSRTNVTHARSMGLHGLYVPPERKAPEPPTGNHLGQSDSAPLPAVSTRRTPASLALWLSRRAVRPADTSTMRTEAADDAGGVSFVATGRGGDGPPLACWLGADPSSTLVCAATHRPVRLWLIVDATSGATVECARRLKRVAASLPCRELRTVSSDLFGARLRLDLEGNADFQDDIRNGLICNVSPGRKIQTLSLASVPGMAICSLDNQRGVVSGLATELPLRGPSIEVQTTTCAGPLLRPGKVATGKSPWQHLAVALLEAARCQCVGPAGLAGRNPRRLGLGDGRALELVTRKSLLALVLLQPVAPRKVLVPLPLDVNDGAWFEQLVAESFAAAGADEVRRNVKWAWPERFAPRRNGERMHWHRDETDVVARFGPRFVVVSCKAGKFKPRADAREVAAVASMGCGRFALPVLAVPFRPAGLGDVLPGPGGAVWLDLTVLADPAALAEWVRDQFKARSAGAARQAAVTS